MNSTRRKLILEQAWIGDAVLSLFTRRHILAAGLGVDSTAFERMTSNRFLAALGDPSSVEAEIGRAYESGGLPQAFAWIDEHLMPRYRRQEEKRLRGLTQKPTHNTSDYPDANAPQHDECATYPHGNTGGGAASGQAAPQSATRSETAATSRYLRPRAAQSRPTHHPRRLPQNSPLCKPRGSEGAEPGPGDIIKATLPGIYISWPFCAQKCTYCNFASGVLPRELEAQYPDALLREVAATEFSWQPETVYLGGGTPSGMATGVLQTILNSLPGFPWREATMEAAPGSFGPDQIAGWVDAGINRVSLGVQSFMRAELARTGRRHDAETVVRDVAALRSGGISNINADLIAGLPGQTAAGWQESVAAAIQLEVPHVSVYMLEVDEDSRLGNEILLGGKRYGAPDVPNDDAVAGFYEFAVEELARAGIHRYEISNFARTGFESLHNLKYWRREPYLGFGADAHSFDAGMRWQNPESVPDYLRAGTTAPERIATNPVEEKFFVGLRMGEGVETTAADWLRFGPAFERFLADGMLARVGDRLMLTPRGVMVSNEIFGEFIGT